MNFSLLLSFFLSISENGALYARDCLCTRSDALACMIIHDCIVRHMYIYMCTCITNLIVTILSLGMCSMCIVL